MDQYESNNFIWKCRVFQVNLSDIPMNHRLQMRELESVFDYDDLLYLNFLIYAQNKIKEFQANRCEYSIIQFHQNIRNHNSQHNCKRFIKTSGPKELSKLAKSDSYLITDISLEQIEKQLPIFQIEVIGYYNRGFEQFSSFIIKIKR
ncbi:unnamed protein product [Paramecium octaurelia]|uniref:Uncharacterized protein n=1 Tax=Paramecium octaurelia TaxID=43137 RepID=A0A8S1XM36_PAROT|nr:unnamed protein product [Paramecium octaurelia]